MCWVFTRLRLGFVEGRNVTIECCWAGAQFDRLPKLAADLVGRKVDVIFAFTLTSALPRRIVDRVFP